MSTLSTLLVLPLNSVGATIGLPNLGSWVSKFVTIVSQAETNEEVLSELSQIQNSLTQIGDQLTDISAQISSFESLFQTTVVSQYTTVITTLYDDIQDLAATPITTAAEMADVQTRMIAIGANIINDDTGIYNCINEINTLLLSNPQPGSGLMYTGNATFISQNEFFSYYASIHSMALNYYGYYAQALFCVNWAMALDTSGLIHFPEGQTWLDQINANTTSLQVFLDTQIPGTVSALVTALVNSNTTPPSATVAISATVSPYWYLTFNPASQLTLPSDVPLGQFASLGPSVATLAALPSGEDIGNPSSTTQYRFSISFPTGEGLQYMVPTESNQFITLSNGGANIPSYTISANESGNFVFEFHDDVFPNAPFMNWVLSMGLKQFFIGPLMAAPVTPPASPPTFGLRTITGTPPVWTTPLDQISGLQIVHHDGQGYWENIGGVPGALSSGADLALAGFGDGLFVFWRGLNDDTGIYFQSLAPASGAWSGLGTIPGADSSTGWVGAAAFNDVLYVGWRGVGNDAAIYLATLDSAGAWSSPSTLPGAYTDTGPTFAVYNGALYCSWKGVNGDDRVFLSSQTTNGAWSTPTPIPDANTTTGGIALTAFNGGLVAAWRGVGNDAAIYSSTYSESTGGWTTLAAIPGAFSSTGPALAIDDGELAMVWSGSGTDSQVYYSAMNADGVWSHNLPIPAGATEANCAAAAYGGNLYLGWVWPSPPAE